MLAFQKFQMSLPIQQFKKTCIILTIHYCETWGFNTTGGLTIHQGKKKSLEVNF